MLVQNGGDFLNRIWIAGSSGSGKTTLANLVGKKYDIPVYHRDYITWDEALQKRTEDEQIEVLKNITCKNKWIFEGCRFTASKIDGRLEYCDIIIYLNINRFICLYLGLMRYYKHVKRKVPKSDFQEFTLQHIKYVLYEYPRKAQERQKIFTLARQTGIDVIILDGRKSVKEFCRHHNLDLKSELKK